ncbi:MAG: ribosome maturation factor RimP [Lachnospiraceae bacterium]|nr:ribosome maturation factor RimP [Lachnospiraceae bacterium]MDD6449960.1 ribosome maturation factor RimP [Lachnospiraceae bacterium]MDD6451695.1 ribosome maturation factor RimP [Lachnospiraceae bacterium]MDD6578512.1 ribosome maturation factor RimP [Lachnospiraceae bacterium]
MSKKSELYEKKTEAFLQPILDRMGFELVDVEFVKEAGEYFLRAYIDKPGGIELDDCVAVSQEMNEILDREDYISEAYTFEVSSPGLTRPLKKEKDYQRNLKKPIEVRTYKAYDGEKYFMGDLEAYTDDTITLKMPDGELTIQRSDISAINQAFVE